MRALVIEHDPMCPPGTVGDRLVRRGYELTRLVVVPEERRDEPGVACSFPDPTQWDLVVALGAPWSVNDEAIDPWITDELALLRAAHDAGMPVLGICFGGQALAAALGGAVERAPRTEIGWAALETDEDALVGPGPWFEYHTDRWTVPPAAVEIARNEIGSQAFRMGRTLAVQFHPEVTTPIVQRWLAWGSPEKDGVDPAALLDRTRDLAAAAERRAHTLVDAFLDLTV